MVTTHPPVLVDNTPNLIQPPPPPPVNTSNEVVIVSNATNKTHIESSDEECYPSLDSLEYPPPSEFRDKSPKAKKLDESEVLIVDSSYVINDSGLGISDDNSRLLDTSHVSVVKIDEEKVQVKDSTSYIMNENLRNSTSDLSNTSSGKSCKSDYGDEIKSTILLDGSESPYKYKVNGQNEVSNYTYCLKERHQNLFFFSLTDSSLLQSRFDSSQTQSQRQ